MSPITHFLIGWGLANSDPSLTKRERAVVTWASVVPDLDGLGIIAEALTRNSSQPLNWYTDYHHLLGHNLGFALLVTSFAMILTGPKLKTILLVLLSFHAHLLGDLVGARGPDGDQWPIPYLLPFSKQFQLTWSGQWVLNAWPNFLITLILLAVAVLLARRRGFSPLEMFSAKADAAFVGTLRARFPLQAHIRKSSKLESSLLQLVRMRTSQINGCAYCLDMHSKDARAEGETEQRLYCLPAWRETPFYSDRERAALAWTEAVTQITVGHVPDETFEEARKHFSEEELANLTLAVVAINGWNRFCISFRVVPGTYQPGTIHPRPEPHNSRPLEKVTS